MRREKVEDEVGAGVLSVRHCRVGVCKGDGLGYHERAVLWAGHVVKRSEHGAIEANEHIACADANSLGRRAWQYIGDPMRRRVKP